MAKIMDSILPILSILEYWAIILGFFGGPGWFQIPYPSWLLGPESPNIGYLDALGDVAGSRCS